MSVADGFSRGFGLMDAHYARKHRQDMDEKQMGMNEEAHGLRVEQMRGNLRDAGAERYRNNQRWQNYEEDREETQKDREDLRARNKVLEQREDQAYEDSRQDRENSLQDRKDRKRRERKQENLADEQAARNRRNDIQTQADRHLRDLAHGVVNDNAVKFWKANPQFDPLRTLGYDRKAAVKTLMDVANPKTKTRANDPQALKAANLFFWDELQKGTKKGQKKEIARVVPGSKPGTVAFHLKITNPDGSSYEAPMTIGRGTEGEAEVSQIPLSDLMDRMQGDQYMRETLQHPMFKEGIDKYRKVAGMSEKDAKLDPQTELRRDVLQDELNRLTDQHNSVMGEAGMMGEPTPEVKKELERIQAEAQEVRQQLFELAQLETPNGDTGSNFVAPKPTSIGEAVSIIMAANEAKGRQVTQEQAMAMARQRFPELEEKAQADQRYQDDIPAPQEAPGLGITPQDVTPTQPQPAPQPGLSDTSQPQGSPLANLLPQTKERVMSDLKELAARASREPKRSGRSPAIGMDLESELKYLARWNDIPYEQIVQIYQMMQNQNNR